MLRRNCRSCTIVGPSVLDSTHMPRWVRAGRAQREAPRPHLGAAQLHRRQPLPHQRHALAAEGDAQDEGEDLVHRDRRPRAPRQRLADRVRRLEDARGQGDAAGGEARAPEPAGPARLLLPLGRARRRTRPGTPRCSIAAAARGRPTRSSRPTSAAPARRTACWRRGGPRSRSEGARAGGRRARGRRRRLRQQRRDPARRDDGRHDADRLLVAADAGPRRLARHRRRREARARRRSHGKIGKYTINFSSLDEAGARAARQAAAETARTAMADTQTVGADRHGRLRRRARLDPAAQRVGHPARLARRRLPGLHRAAWRRTSPSAGTRPRGARSPASSATTARRRARSCARRARGGSWSRPRATTSRGARRRGAARGARGRRACASSPGPRGAVIYAGADPVNAAGVAESVARESPGARVVLPDELVRAGIDGRLRGRAARAAVFVSRAPAPGSTPALRASRPPSSAPTGASPGPTPRSATRR